MAAMLRRILAILTITLLAACGGGGDDNARFGSGLPEQTPTQPTPTPTLTNVATVTIDDGPAALATGDRPTRAVNIPYVSVTLCVPGTQTCRTIDHIQVDTGSVGLRVLRSAVDSAFASALPQQRSGTGNPVGECYTYVSGYVFGSVRTADFRIAGESVSAMPFHLVGDDGVFATVPSRCSAGGGDQLSTVQDFASNGILGIGSTDTDCGPVCAGQGGFAAAIYYDCPQTGCSTVITRAARTTGPFEQLPNPVAAFAVNNNGTILEMPAIGANGARTATGTLTFGIGTQTNNRLGTARVLTLTESGSRFGPGYLTVNYRNGAAMPLSFVDSGTNFYVFNDPTISRCAGSYTSFYCPPSPLSLDLRLTGANGTTGDGSFTLYNALAQIDTGNAALPGVGIDPEADDMFAEIAEGVDLGFPFFYGRRVLTAIEGRQADGTRGPYLAF